MRKMFNFLAGKKLPPQDISVTERPKKPRAPRVRRTGERLSWGQWEYLLALPCWDFWEKKKLETMRMYYPLFVTPNQFRKEFGGEGHWVQSSFQSLNGKLRELRLPYRVEAETGGFQVVVVAPVSERV